MGLQLPTAAMLFFLFFSVEVWSATDDHRAITQPAASVGLPTTATRALQMAMADSMPSAQPNADTGYIDQGLDAYRQGDYQAAIKLLSQAERLAKKQGDKNRQFDALLYLSDAYAALGLHQKRQAMLTTAQALAKSLHAPARLIGLSSRTVQMLLEEGKFDAAVELLESTIEQAKTQGLTDLLPALWNDFGNLYLTVSDYRSAANVFDSSKKQAQQTQQWLLAARAGINHLKIQLVEPTLFNAQDFESRFNDALKATQRLDSRYTRIENYLALADVLRNAQQKYHGPANWRLVAYNVLVDTLSLIKGIKNDRLKSYTFGYLGLLYADEGQYTQAEQYTRQAIFYAQLANAHESLYRWEWQQARLLRATNQHQQAITGYRNAIDTLQKIRPSLVANSQNSFRELVGPIYLELADLMLTQTASLNDPEAVQQNLLDIRRNLEQVKVAEIEDYFQHECVLPKEKTLQLEKVAKKSAILYPVLLRDRIELIVSFPDGMKRYVTNIPADELSQTVISFRTSLEQSDNQSDDYYKYGLTLYQWLIAPLDAELQRQHVETLVLIPDGPLRSIPLAALYDGRKFLVERFAIATTIGLSLTSPTPIKRKNTQVLLNGLTKEVRGLPALPSVNTELKNISHLYPSKILKDERFKLAPAEKEMSQGNYSIVHIASHGHFDRQYEESYILTYDDPLTMDSIEKTIGQRRYSDDALELLVLSACETAAGDDRAALGLAGVALKAGARSALATLWLVNDDATAKLVSEFYRLIKTNAQISKAKALQEAQKALLKTDAYHHPNRWAPFLLLGNWL